MEESTSYKTFTALKPHFEALARVGYYRIVGKEIPSWKRSVHNAYCIIIFTLVAGYNLQHIVKAIQLSLDTFLSLFILINASVLQGRLITIVLAKTSKNEPKHDGSILFSTGVPMATFRLHHQISAMSRHNVDHMVDTLFILLTTINTMGKQISFNARSRRIDNIINIVNGTIFEPRNEIHVKILKNNALMMSRLLKLYHIAVLMCGSLWAVFPFVNRALGQEVRLTGYIPFDTSETLNFDIAVTYMSILIILQAYANATLDCTIVAFYSQAKTQIQLLRYNFENLVVRDSNIVTINNNIFNEEWERKYLQKRFFGCIKHYEQIVWFTKEIESIFKEAMVIQFSTSSWVICMTVYKIVALNIFSMEFFSIALYLVCMLAQLFIYCYYGTQLIFESEFISQSLYSGDWLSVSPRFRKFFLLMMNFCSRPIAVTAAIVIPMTLETYISLLRCSYTLFTFLNRK